MSDPSSSAIPQKRQKRPFNRFPSISNSLEPTLSRTKWQTQEVYDAYVAKRASERQDAIESTAQRSLIAYVTEKIDGANAALCYDMEDGKMHIQSRNNVLTPESKFFNSQVVFETYSPVLPALAKDVVALMPEEIKDARVYVFGELYGGFAPANPPPIGVSAVQKRIVYSAQNKFVAFAIIVKGADDGSDITPAPETPAPDNEDEETVEQSTSTYRLSVEQANALFEKYGIPYVPVLFKGTFEDALEYARNTSNDNSLLCDVKLPEECKNPREGNILTVEIAPFRASLFKYRGSNFQETSKMPRSDKQKQVERAKALSALEKRIAEYRKNDTFGVEERTLSPETIATVKSKGDTTIDAFVKRMWREVVEQITSERAERLEKEVFSAMRKTAEDFARHHAPNVFESS